MAEHHFVYKDVEGASTQWDDIQRKLGNLPPKPLAFKPHAFTPAPDSDSLSREKSWIDDKTEEELEDDPDLDDDRFLEEYNADKGNLGVPQLPGQGCSFHSFRTNTYKLSFMESPSGIKIILVTHPRTGDLREALKYIYNLYVEYVAKNPVYAPGAPIKSELFNTNLDQYVRSIS